MKAKKLLFLPLLLLSMVFFVQCSEDPYFTEADEAATESALKKAGPPDDKGGGGHTEVVGNNLSFPAIAVDGFGITDLAEPSFLFPYNGEYPGLTQEQIDYLEANGPWYAQKTEGNTWQADFDVATSDVKISFVDWGDVIESVNPKLRRPFRLEVTLYKSLDNSMEAYTMAELEFPSSSSELQGTNTIPYESDFATVASSKPKLVLQYLGDLDHDDLWWDDVEHVWKIGPIEDPETPEEIDIVFSTELNVGGKYIYGASRKGWKPDQVGYYRITFYIPNDSNIDLSEAIVDNYSNQVVIVTQGMRTIILSEDEGGAATPVVRGDLNLTFVDVLVVTGGGGGKP